MSRRFIIGLLLVSSLLGGAFARAGEQEKTDLLGPMNREFERHNYKKVIELYRDYTTSHPNDYVPLPARVWFSQSLADTGEIDEAIKALRDLLMDFPPQLDLVQLQYDLANLLFLQKRYDEARAAFQKIIGKSTQGAEIVAKARERLALMKDKDTNAKKKDFISLQLMEIESALEAGEVPDAASTLLQQIADQNPTSPQADQARRLQARVKEVRTEKAKALLDEARRLFDVEKKYAEVREILDQITTNYSDVCEAASVEALKKAVSGSARVK